MTLMYNKKIIYTIFHVLCFCTSSLVFSQSNYRAPVYTAVDTAKTKDLSNSIANSTSKKVLEFKDLNAFNTSNQDGFMVQYTCTQLLDNWTDFTLLEIESSGSTLLKIYFVGNNTLKLRRYKSSTKFVDYTIFDRLFPIFHGVWNPVIKFYFGKDFIWIESLDDNGSNTWQTPIFWGIDVSSFLSRGTTQKIHFYKPRLGNANDIFIYGFKTEDLIKHLNDCFINSKNCTAPATPPRNDPPDGGIARRSTKTKDTIAELEALNTLEIESIKIFPNPIDNKRVNIAFPDDLVGQSISINLMDINGRLVLDKTISVNKRPGTKHQLQLPNNIQKGVYILQLKSAHSIITNKKILVE